MKKTLLFSLAAVLILCVGITVGMNFNKQKNTSDSTPEKEVAPEEIEYSDNKVVSDESEDSTEIAESKKEIEYMTQEDKVWVFQETYDNTQQMIKDQGGSDSQCFEAELADLPIYLDYYKNMFEGRVSPDIDTLREEYKTWRIENYGGGTSSKSESSKPTQTQNQSQQKPSQSQAQTQTQQKPSSNQNQSSSNNSGNGSTSGSSSLGPLGSSGASHNSINIIGENRTQEQIEKDIQATKEASEKSTLSQNANWS